MLNIEVVQEIHKLCSQYEKRWGKEVDCIGMPSVCTQEKLLQAMRIIVDTGESVLCGLKKVKDLNLSFNNYLMEYHDRFTIPNGFVFEKPCPFCGNKVIYHNEVNSWEYRCETKNCFKSTFRGI